MPKRRAIWIFVVLLMLYPVSYLVVSRHGLYSPTFGSAILAYTRGVRIVGNDDDRTITHQWEPFPIHPGKDPAFRKTLSTFYRPLILIDRRFFHPDIEKTLPKTHEEPEIPELPAMPFPVLPPSDTIPS